MIDGNRSNTVPCDLPTMTFVVDRKLAAQPLPA
jgi:hypothetical protein